MFTTNSAQKPRWRVWCWVAGLGLGVLVLGATWKIVLRYQAASELRAVGLVPRWKDVWEVAREDWRDLFKRETWRVDRTVVTFGSGGAAQMRNLDAVGPALRRLKVEVIFLTACRQLQNLDALKDLQSLKCLCIGGCSALQNVDGLKGLTALRELELSRCDALENIDALHSLTALRRINLSGSTKISTESIASLKAALPNAVVVGPFPYVTVSPTGKVIRGFPRPVPPAPVAN